MFCSVKSNAKNNPKNNPKNNAKRALAREESKMAENDRLVAAGVCIDANLTPCMLKTIAVRLKERIEGLSQPVTCFTYSLLKHAESKMRLGPA